MIIDCTDEELVLRSLKGDDDALKLLILRYLKLIFNFVRQYVNDFHLAEDITQDVFVKVWKNLGKFDQTKSFKNWIFKIAKNTVFDFLKKKKILSFSMFEEQEDQNLVKNLVDPELLPDELLRRKDLKKIVETALEKLDAPYRAVIFLYYQNGFNFREIADILEESIDTIKSRHRRALIALKKYLE